MSTNRLLQMGQFFSSSRLGPSSQQVGRRSPFAWREFFKITAHALASLLILPALTSYRIKWAILGRDRALEGSTEALSLIPGLVGQYLRRAFLARVLDGGCHRSVTVCFGTVFSKAGAGIGPRAYIGPRCHIGLAMIEHDALLAAGVHVTSGARIHGFADLSRPIRDQDGVPQLVRIKAGSWIGSGAVVMAEVGCDTIVGSGAVVSKPLPDRVIAVGVPAQVVRQREEIMM